jgi:hypothetical protein
MIDFQKETYIVPMYENRVEKSQPFMKWDKDMKCAVVTLNGRVWLDRNDPTSRRKYYISFP